MKENKDEITRGEAIKKMGRYAGFAALGTCYDIESSKRHRHYHHHLILEDGEGSQEVILEMLLGVNLQVNGGNQKRNKSFQIKLICILNDSTTK